MSRQRYIDFRDTDAGQRLLNTIAYAEGTAGPQGYNTMFTHALFNNNYADHPRQLQQSGGLVSDAAGRYQFLSTTWDPTAAAIGASDFSPLNQDLGALYKAEQRLNQAGLSLQDVVSEGMSKRVADALAPEWASFPTAATGTSYYGQGGKSLEQLQQFFGGEYENLATAQPGYGRTPVKQEVEEPEKKVVDRFAGTGPIGTAVKGVLQSLGFN